ncbi:hypothetical protein [Sphingobacterium mizutaii]|uniref:hypothetical protein n=1 Tax=Sphingobacterium mizutaii TaxID=1010 RepID=UPI0016240BCC|nr:hypothetical protein [Sphingobacterium mizutaii]
MENKEQELLIELNKVEELIEKVKVTRDIIVKAYEIQQLLIIHSKLKEVYPTVHFTNPSGGCGSCVWDFLQQIIPVFDRLTSSPKAIEEVVVGSIEYNRQNVNEVNPFNPIGHDEVVEEPKKRGGRKKKGDNK